MLPAYQSSGPSDFGNRSDKVLQAAKMGGRFFRETPGVPQKIVPAHF